MPIQKKHLILSKKILPARLDDTLNIEFFRFSLFIKNVITNKNPGSDTEKFLEVVKTSY